MHTCITEYKNNRSVHASYSIIKTMILILCKRMLPCIYTRTPCACMHGICRDQKTAPNKPGYQVWVLETEPRFSIEPSLQLHLPSLTGNTILNLIISKQTKHSYLWSESCGKCLWQAQRWRPSVTGNSTFMKWMGYNSVSSQTERTWMERVGRTLQ